VRCGSSQEKEVRVLKLSQSAALRELQELRANNEAIRCAHLRRDCPLAPRLDSPFSHL
jgi:hypothetical protein